MKVDDTDDNNSHYALVTKLCDAMIKSAKRSIPRGKTHKFKPFWTKELTNQRNKRDQAQEVAKSLRLKMKNRKEEMYRNSRPIRRTVIFSLEILEKNYD